MINIYNTDKTYTCINTEICMICIGQWCSYCNLDSCQAVLVGMVDCRHMQGYSVGQLGQHDL